VEVYKVQRLVDYCCTFLVKEHGLEVLLAQYRLPLEILEHLREDGEFCPSCENYFYGAQNYSSAYAYRTSDEPMGTTFILLITL